MSTAKKPRGIRNNNPLNIRLSKDKWKGRALTQTDGEFFQFVSMPYGIRAAFIILRRYIRTYKRDTIEKIISRWAPVNENNTKGYIDRVAAFMNYPACKPIDYDEFGVMRKLVKAMSIVENGGNYLSDADIASGYMLAG